MKYLKLRIEMLKRGYKYKHLATLLNVTEAVISHRFTGRSDFTFDEVKKICEHFNMSFEQLFL